MIVRSDVIAGRRFVAVDWSGSQSGGGSQIWLAAVEEGALIVLEGPMTRAGVIATLLAWKAAAVPLLVGLDFGFSAPAWFLSRVGCRTAPEFWSVAGERGEAWLADCPPPFWGRPGRRRGSEIQFRQTELECGGAPKSVFQVGGAGAVGTGSIRGMPHLSQLRSAGFAIWPFDAPAGATVLEIYPRLLTGPGPKRREQWCRSYLAALGWPSDPLQRAAAASREDAFDAAVSALRLWEAREELAALAASAVPIDQAEGRIWRPTRPIAGIG